MRVLIAEHDHPVYAQLLRQAAPDLEVLTSGDSAELASQAADCPIWLGQPDLLANLLRQGHQPQWLQSTWAGITPLLADGLRRDYRLTRAVGIFGQVMAEYVLTYMLGHEREVLARLVSQVERKWDSRQGQSLAGRKVLIVGTGDIGLTVAKFLVPFGVELYGIASEAREQAPFVEVGVLADLPRLVGEVDFVINLLPNTPNTHDLYDAALFKQFKPTGLFINVGRGVAVVDADLVEALKEGHLAGAVIDVCRQEPLPQRHPFWTAWGLLLTGHSSAPTSPSMMVKLFVENLRAYQAGEALRGEVDFNRGY
ncbi:MULTISPECIES: D-2-hydroxyacid dehydrogenase [Pseudomonas]|jgi:phosphoglycerate dehydrogenase-like enzyme|uniref:D-2-hydroxyacid dehydrogenase n=3 Tax=Pseudomonas mandelii TaxID=75612 RepID=A0AB36CRN1_9PSED|nr:MULTISPECIES: D-2-hydroxyacid dehydrogenase [Pseudomonas]MBU0521143.1 D-2-hydroxyacid dehydrogenase [Gammaproteobacteria bacterium]AHZ69037.1 D-isomer specific 2-hydroxyacid dehydrogenase, NAD-binding [Pseudomonas mandelii JR-1]MBA4364078.1 D-2-hydroxyacid dehydrogenase [Pseudomonas sp.]MBU0821168.1 D-2-hydroxyacid dehydrogenase [Gammaproteobacteria bacterium]MBU0842545.1 D-2-hydroxyacid dehydrogenase [Gammaproteobacteria bacterium]